VAKCGKTTVGYSMPKDSIRTRVATVDTAKHFIIPTKTVLFKKFTFSVHKAA